MVRSLRLTGIAVVLLFVALFTSTSVIQVVAADSLSGDNRNVRNLYESFSAERGQILAGDRAIATSIAVDTEFRYLRTYPEGELFAPVHGYYTLNQGNAGIESAMNAYLTGRANSQFFERITALVTGQPPQGARVLTSIDPELQRISYEALDGRPGAVIVMEPDTGRILAMVSSPTYDPNQLAQHQIPSVVDYYNSLNEDPQKPLSNRAIAGDQYFPGSVFKVLMTAAALDSGRYTANSEFPNPPELQLPLSTSIITNSGGSLCGAGETVTLEVALIRSCNIPFAELGLELGEGTIGSMADDFGFGATLEIPLRVTPSKFPRGMDQAQLMLSSFGQYDVRVTPLQVAMMMSAVANDGILMTPTLVDQVLSPDLQVLEETTPREYSQPISESVARELTRILVAGVSQGVAGQAAISGVDVAGKTGTAETGIDEGRYFWFTGFAPATDPDLVVAVVIEGVSADGTANRVAAPVARTILEAGVGR
jgi:peptidoglycan glycosyltransferase